MTVTFDSKIYSELLLKHQPRIIKTEEENEKSLEVVEELLSRSTLTIEEDTLLELLVKLIEDFEEKNYQLNTSTPRSRLLHLLEARDLKLSDLEIVLGSRELADRIVTEEFAIAPQHAKILGEFFHVHPNLFLIDNNVALNIDNSTITNQINELPATSEPEKPGIKELLEQLQTAINADENLSDPDKAIALEQVQNLVQAGKEPKNSINQGIAKRAFLMLQGIVAGLPAAAKLTETCKNIIPTISSIFGL